MRSIPDDGRPVHRPNPGASPRPRRPRSFANVEEAIDYWSGGRNGFEWERQLVEPILRAKDFLIRHPEAHAWLSRCNPQHAKLWGAQVGDWLVITRGEHGRVHFHTSASWPELMLEDGWR